MYPAGYDPSWQWNSLFTSTPATSLSHLPLALFGHHFQTAVLLLGCAWNIYYHFLWFCQRNALRLAVKWPLLILWVRNRDENAGEALRVCLGSCECSWSTVSHWRVVGDPCLNGLRPSLPWVSETEGLLEKEGLEAKLWVLWGSGTYWHYVRWHLHRNEAKTGVQNWSGGDKTW